MAQSSNTLIVGVVVALVIGAGIGWFVYPAMNPPLSEEDYVPKETYDALLADYSSATDDLDDKTAELGEIRSDLIDALGEAALATYIKKEVMKLAEGKKVGLILATGGLGDKSFNDISFAGVQRAKDELGVDFDYVEPTAIAEYEGYQRDFAMSGEYEIIICVGFDQADALTLISTEYPDQDFAIVDMPVFTPNVASLLFGANEASFLVGVVAGMVTETGKVGFVGGMDDPLIWDFFEGYEAGALWVNPDVEVMTPVFVGSWADPTKGKELAIGLIELGADAMYAAGGKSGLGALDAAHERGITGFGVDSCQCYLYPEIIASMSKRVDNAVYEMILSSLLGTFEGGIHAGGLAERWTGLCRLPEEENLWEVTYDFEHDPLPEGVIEKVKEARDLIIAGEITVPTGYD